MSKHFLLNPNIQRLSKEEILLAEEEKNKLHRSVLSSYDNSKKEILSKEHTLKAVDGKVIVQVDVESKNFWTFENGQKIRYERQFDNFNRRQTEPVNAIVIDGENIKAGSEILIHPNAIADHHQIHNYRREESDIKYYSIPIEMCFIYREDNEWLPIEPYEKALRVYKPYEGVLENIKPALLKDTLYILTGNYKGLCCRTLKASDYEIIFQDTNGKEGRLLRCRPDGDEKHKREPEVIAIDHALTELINKGKILIGLSESDAKPINEWKQ